MRRWLFRIAAGVSLLLCLAIAPLWVRSYFQSDAIIWKTGTNPNRMVGLYSGRGGVQLLVASISYSYSQGIDPATPALQSGFSYLVENNPVHPSAPLPGTSTYHQFLGFGFRHTTDTSPQFYKRRFASIATSAPGPMITSWSSTANAIYVPHWFLLACFACPPALLIRRIIKQRRKLREGLCPACGYDLRATPDRCPECGTIPPAAKGAAI